MKHALVLVALVWSLFPAPARAAAGPVISQLQVSGPAGADDEFVEIHNPAADPASLAGWSLQYKSAAGAYPVAGKKNLPDVAIRPGGYFLVVGPGYSGAAVPDLVHSSFSLSGAAAGGTVFLASSIDPIASPDGPSVVDRLGYGTGSGNAPEGVAAPLPPAGRSLARVSDTGDNAVDFAVGDSHPRNSSYALATDVGPAAPEPVPAPAPDPVPDNPPEPEPQPAVSPGSTPEPEPATEALPEPQPGAGVQPGAGQGSPPAVAISEAMPNPPGADGGAEWVELENPSGEAAVLDGWFLDDDGPGGEPGGNAWGLGGVTLPPNALVRLVVPPGKFSLNNTGQEAVRLVRPDRTLADRLPYSGPAPDGVTWCRLAGGPTWCEPTPGGENQPLPEPEDEPDGGPGDIVGGGEEDGADRDFSSHRVRVVSFMPDPEGKDAGNETVTLRNEGSRAADLEGWFLDDGLPAEPKGSTAYRLGAVSLAPGKAVEVALPAGKSSLNNTTPDGIRLFDPAGRLRHAVEYPKAKEGLAFVFQGGEWEQSGPDGSEGVRGEGDGDVLAAAIVESAGLPRTGLPPATVAFATLPAIWYIGGKRKGNNEQTRSHRGIGS